MRMFISTNLHLAIEPPEVSIEHKGMSVVFSVSVFGRRTFQAEYDIFEEINKYWSGLPEETQDAIYSIYVRLHELLTNIIFQDNMVEDIALAVKALYEFHQFDDLKRYVSFKSNIRIPSNIPTEYVRNVDINTSRDKTYIRSDYSDLMCISLMLRPMMGIWGEYIANNRKNSGTNFKEYYAFRLVKYTNIDNLEPVLKLYRYIEAILGNKFRPDSILMGISSEDYTNWLLCNLCVRKLVICDLRGIDDQYNAISYLHRYINQKAENRDNNYENLYKEKVFDENITDGGSKISILESYKIKSSISPGEVVELEHSISDLRGIAQQLSHNIQLESLDTTMKSVSIINKSIIVDIKLVLLAYVFKRVISVRSMPYFNKLTIAKMLCVAEEVLWSRGHHYLALLLTTYPHEDASDLTISPVDGRMKLDGQLAEKFVKYYPYTRVLNSKRKAQQKVINIAVNAVNELVDELSLYTWILTARADRVVEVFGSNTKRCPIVPDIKNKIVELIIDNETN